MDRKKLMEKLTHWFFWKPASFDSIVDDFHPLDPLSWLSYEWNPSIRKQHKNPLDDSVVDEPKLAEFNLGGYNR